MKIEDWPDNKGWIKVLVALERGFDTPKKISSHTGMHTTTIQRRLKELQHHDWIEKEPTNFTMTKYSYSIKETEHTPKILARVIDMLSREP